MKTIIETTQPRKGCCPGEGRGQGVCLGRPDVTENHPCFSASAHNRCGRIHIPASPECNIRCRFCKRDFNPTDIRPGVSRGLVAPEKAVELIRRALLVCPEITVVGIAGPGDTLATDHALRTFEAIHQVWPELINCMSTNGLELPGQVGRIVAAGVRTLTVTVNAVDPGIQKEIISGIVCEGRFFAGIEAAELLISRQLAGIREAAAAGLAVKVNTVLVPGVNSAHIGGIAMAAAAAGARLMNIIPLLPQADFTGIPAPSAEELAAAFAEAGKYIDVFRHCKRCRADAVGIPGAGADFADALYEQRQETFSHG